MRDFKFKDVIGTSIKRTQGLSVQVHLRDGSRKQFYFSNDLVKFLLDDLYSPQKCSVNTLVGLWRRGIIRATPTAPLLKVTWPYWPAQRDWHKAVAREHHWTLNPFGMWLVQEIQRWIYDEQIPLSTFSMV